MFWHIIKVKIWFYDTSFNNNASKKSSYDNTISKTLNLTLIINTLDITLVINTLDITPVINTLDITLVRRHQVDLTMLFLITRYKSASHYNTSSEDAIYCKVQ